MNYHTCKNCGIKFYGAYCNNCGQKNNVGRLNWPAWLENIMYGITNVERGILFTIKELFTRPGYMMQDYLMGKRIQYFKPFSMLFVLAAAYALLTTLVFSGPESKREDVSPEKITNQALVTEVDPAVADEEDEVVIRFREKEYSESDIELAIEKIKEPMSVVRIFFREVTDRPGVLSIYLLFSFALVTRWIFRKNGAKQYNYVEFMFIGAYMVCQRFIVDIVLLPYDYFLPDYDGIFSHSKLIFFSYIGLTAWDYKQFFGMRWRGAIWKTLRLFLTSFILAGALVLVIGGLIIVLALVLNALIK